MGWRRGRRIPPDVDDYDRCWSNYYDRESYMGVPIEYHRTGRLWIEFFEMRRMKILTNILAKYMNDGMTIADIGCGDSIIMNIVDGLGVDVKITGLDISEVSINHNIEKWPNQEWIIGNAVHPNLEKESFDVVHAGELIEHLDDECRFLSLMEWCGLVKSGGYIIITTPTPSLKIPYGQHIGFVNEGDVKKAFKKYHIQMVEEHGIGLFIPIHAKVILSIKDVGFRNRLYTWLLKLSRDLPIISDQIIYVGCRSD